MYSLLLLASLSMCHCTSLIYRDKAINTKSKIELSPIEIPCQLNDIVVLTTPVINCNNAKYHLHKPNGDILKRNLSKPKSNFQFYNTAPSQNDNITYENGLIVKYINRDVKTIFPKRTFKILTVNNNYDQKKDDNITAEENLMNDNDFIIGPLIEEDHGNWVLSVYCKDIDGEWIEMFQVITITIYSFVEMNHLIVKVPEGGTFNISFSYPIKNLESCELIVPSTSIDRFFDRNRIELDKCGYVISNVTKNDQGIWQVIGLGRIVYRGEVILCLTDQDTPNSLTKNFYNIINEY